MDKNRKFTIGCCLDEIDVCYNKIESGKLSKNIEKKLLGWVRKQKEQLKEVKYRGKIRRLKKNN